ncbi:glycoside hydrolase superfamily [Mucidula mucida]|nr:glycoside hydrolase superfamily [Mucidula mucida]
MWMTVQFQTYVGEKIYGLGERFGPFVKNGQAVEMWNESGGTSSELAYKSIPFFLSSRGYGVFVASLSESASRINISVPLEAISLYIVHGPTPKAIIERYTSITGRPALPPPWTFDLWLSTSFTTEYDESTVTSFLQGMQDRDISVGVFHFDSYWMKAFQWCDFEFDNKFFPDAKGQLSRLKEKGYKICVWINPYIAQESKIFDEGVKGGFFVKKQDGSVWQFDYWQAGMAFVDFTNPAACAWYQSKLVALMDMGVDTFKMHNYYAFLYNKITFEAVEKYKGKHEAIVFARAATAGGQRFPVHWGGDPLSTFEAMAETLRGGLSLGVSGFGYWAHDIGGFMHDLGGGGFHGGVDPALYKRWFAFGALSSHSRLHGSGSYRVPWLVDETGEADLVLKKFIDLKLSLMPYLYATAIDTHKTGVPMMRPLFMEFPEDPICWTIDTQYMLGANLMVCPIFNQAGSVQFYVPEGNWYGMVDGKMRRGPRYFVETHDFMSLPVLLRPGGVVVLGNCDGEAYGRRLATYDYANEVRVIVNPGDGVVDVEVRVPDSRSLGDDAAVLRVCGDASGVEVVVVGVS